MWSLDGSHLVYYVRKGEGRALMLDGQEVDQPSVPGIALQAIQDDRGNVVGAGLMNGPQIDRGAFASAVVSAEADCDPVSARTVAGSVSCVREDAEGRQSVVVQGQAEGPYDEIRGTVLTSRHDNHYAYVVRSNEVNSVVLDGWLMAEQYDRIFRIQFVSEEEVAFLGLRENSLHHVRYGL